ncbi:MAG: HPr family phosphocarrier protein [Brevinema sp.]
MLQKNIVIKNKYGIHARPSSKISEIVNQSNSTVLIKYNENQADASSVMSLILLSIEPNSQIELIVEGDDEQIIFNQLVNYLEIQLMNEELEV